MSRIPVVAGSPVVVSASAADKKTIVSQSGTIAYTNTDGSGTLSSSPVTVANDTTLSIASGRGYAFVADVFGVPDTVTEASLPSSVASRSELSVNLRTYADLNVVGGADASAIINQALEDVSTAAVAADTVGELYIARNAILRVDENIIPQPRVRFRSDGCRIVAGADMALSGMFRSVPAAQIASASVGSATTTNGSYLLTSVAQIDNYYPEMVISGTGIQSGSKVVSVSKVTSTVAIDKPATASGTVVITRAGTYYGHCDHFGLEGFEIDPNEKEFGTSGAIFRMLYLNRPTFKDLIIHHNLPEDGSGWAFQVGGRGGRFDGVDILGGNYEFSDGIHIVHGQDWRVENCHIESGDDMVAIGRDADAVLDSEPDPIRHVTVDDITGRSNMAFAVKVYVDSGSTGRDEEVTDITVSNLNAAPAQTDNGGIRVEDRNTTSAGTSQIKRVTFDTIDLRAGTRGHRDQTTTRHKLIHCISVDDVTFKGVKATVTDKLAPTYGFDLVRIEESRDVTIDGLVVQQMGKGYGFHATDSIRPKLINSTIIGYDTDSSGNPVRVNACEDFTIAGNHFTPRAGQAAIKLDEGTGSFGKIRENTVRALDGSTNCFLLNHTAAAVTYLDVDDNDCTNATRTFESVSEWNSTARAVFPLSAPRRIMTARTRFDAAAAQTTTLNENGSGAFTGASPWYGAFYVDPDDFKKGARTAKCRLELLIAINDTAPTCNIGIAVHAISAPAGAAATISATQGSAVSGSTITATTPAANSLTRTTADFTLPAAGWYVITATIGAGGMAAGSAAMVRGTLGYVEGDD